MINLGRYTLIGHALLLPVLLLKFSQPKVAQAQVITPATDGTGTVVTQDGQSFDIEAGSLSADGTNLFHSFQAFQLTGGNTANFLADPAIQRIFARIKGNDAAFINGTLQITGAEADLFLLNPSGIIFGADVSLNLPANLTATSGNRINFNDGAFKAFASNDYDTLVGSPTAFTFDQPGTIRNQGNLALLPGQTLTLLGGTVINNGTLSADNIQIQEVSEEQIIQISQTGSLLNLEFSGDAFQEGTSDGNFKSTMLPGLLTTGDVEQTGQLVNTPDGQLLITDSFMPTTLTEESSGARYTSQPTFPMATDSATDTAQPASDTAQTVDPQPESNQAADEQANKTQENNSTSLPARHHIHRAVLNTANASAALEEVEDLRTQEFSDYFGRDLGAKELTLPEIQQLLTQVHSQTGNQSVIVYIKTPKLATDIFEQTSIALELLIFKPTGEPISLVIPGVSQADLFQTVEQFRRALIASSRVGSKRYLSTAQTLYQWLIKPIEDELGPDAIDTILFSMGLRVTHGTYCCPT